MSLQPRVYVVAIFPRRGEWRNLHTQLQAEFRAAQVGVPHDLLLLCPNSFPEAQTLIRGRAGEIVTVLCSRFCWGSGKDGEDLILSLRRTLAENAIPVVVLEDPNLSLRRPRFDYADATYLESPWEMIGEEAIFLYLKREAEKRNRSF